MNEKFRHTILLIDDEPHILSSLIRLLRREYHVLSANSAAEGLNLMHQQEVHVILSDQRMPGMEGAEFLSVVKGNYPDTIRMLLTGYADLDSVISAINTGNIYRYLVKPWNPDELIATVREACQKYDLLFQNRQLTQDLITANAQLEERIKDRTANLERANHYIAAYSQVGAHLQAELNYAQVLNTLESELKNHHLNCLVALCKKDHYLRPNLKNDGFLEIIPFEQTETECLSLLKNCPEFKEFFQEQQASFIPNMQSWSANILTYFHQKLPAAFTHLADIQSPMHGALLPLCFQQRLNGMLVLWGEDLMESDLVALSVFSSQVGIALENALLFETVHHLAAMDGLTGVYNRRTLLEMAEREINRALRYQRNFSLIMIDVDRFKQVNDTYGHGAGDRVLQAITKGCKQVLRKGVDMIGRYGGDEFVILLPETNSIIGQNIAERLQAYIHETPIETHGNILTVSISLGVASLSDNITQVDDLLNFADQAMYIAKQAGKKLSL